MPYEDITPQEVKDDLENYDVVDVRSSDEYSGELGHIPSSKLIELDTIEEVAKTLDKDKTYLIVCRSGGRSAKACDILEDEGFDKIFNLYGGMIAWNACGLPTER